jgi:hypothetical protein
MIASPTTEQKTVWAPLPGSQTLAMMCPAHTLLYHGTRGPGKTDAQLMRFRARVGLGYGNYWRGVIFDKEYKNLDDLVSKSQRWFPQFEDGAKFLRSQGDYRWVWPTGEELLFRTIKRESDYWSYHGQEFPSLNWNELTKHPNSDLFDMLMSCNRSSFRPEDHPQKDNDGNTYLLPKIPLEVVATTNPYGVGHHWVKERFIDAGAPGEIISKTIMVFNPQTQEKEPVTKTQTHLFGSYRENIYLSPEYIAELESITDPNKREAWLKGSWEITAGGMFDDIWKRSVHVLPNFEVPKGWRVDRSLDWGSSKPFSVGFWGLSDGSPAMIPQPDGTFKQRTFARGSLIRIGEYYGCEKGKRNTGLRLSASKVAKNVLAKEQELKLFGRVLPGPADSSIYDVTDEASIADNMAKEKVRWTRADKKPGSRKNGWELCRDLLEAAAQGDEKPGLFFMERCKDAIKLFPSLPRDELDLDDVDTDAEDHIGDEIRYRVLGAGRPPLTLVMGYAR